MRSLIFFILLVGTCTHMYSQESSLKVLTYNIWNGYDWGNDEERRSRVNDWIRKQQPTIVALQELCKYTSRKLAEDASTWGHEHSVLLKTTGYSVGLTSQYPIQVKEKIMKNMHHGALHCTTNGIDVFVIHFHPGSYARRREEVAIVLEKLKGVRADNDKYIVMGDFNSQSPMDADLYNPEGALITRLRQSNKDKPLKGNLFHGNLDYAVMSSFLAFPMIDVCQKYTRGINERGSFPGRVLGDLNNESEEELVDRMERIDYIMVSPALADNCINAKVCNGEENYYLSDHYPVYAEFIY